MSRHKYLRYRKGKGSGDRSAGSGAVGSGADSSAEPQPEQPAAPTQTLRHTGRVSREAMGECADDPQRRRLFDEEFERLAVLRGLEHLDVRVDNCVMLIRMWRKEAMLRERELDAETINPARWQVAPGVMQRASRELDELLERRIRLIDAIAMEARLRVKARMDGEAQARATEKSMETLKALQAAIAEKEAAAGAVNPEQAVLATPAGPPSGATLPERAAASPG